MQMKPYVGVTGIMTPQEARAAKQAFLAGTTHQLMLGVLVSPKTLAGGTNKYPNRYPRVERIHEIFQKDPDVFNCIHTTAPDAAPLYDHLMRLVEACGSNVHGFQLNIAWPKVAEFEQFCRNTFDHYRIVLQVGRRALAEVGGSPARLVDRLEDYRHVIHDVLIDASGGQGIPLDVERTCEYLAAIEDWEPEIGKGFAGKLSVKTLHSLANPVIKKFPNASTDAESGLRDPVTDDLDMIGTVRYLQNTQDMLDQNEKMQNGFEGRFPIPVLR